MKATNHEKFRGHNPTITGTSKAFTGKISGFSNSNFWLLCEGQQTINSDLDILIRYDRRPTLWMLGELQDYLTDILGVPVDIVTEKGLKPRIREQVLAESVKI